MYGVSADLRRAARIGPTQLYCSAMVPVRFGRRASANTFWSPPLKDGYLAHNAALGHNETRPKETFPIFNPLSDPREDGPAQWLRTKRGEERKQKKKAKTAEPSGTETEQKANESGTYSVSFPPPNGKERLKTREILRRGTCRNLERSKEAGLSPSHAWGPSLFLLRVLFFLLIGSFLVIPSLWFLGTHSVISVSCYRCTTGRGSLR